MARSESNNTNLFLIIALGVSFENFKWIY